MKFIEEENKNSVSLYCQRNGLPAKSRKFQNVTDLTNSLDRGVSVTLSIR